MTFRLLLLLLVIALAGSLGWILWSESADSRRDTVDPIDRDGASSTESEPLGASSASDDRSSSLSLGKADTPPLPAVRGRIQDEHGIGLEGYRLELRAEGVRSSSATTNELGEFSLIPRTQRSELWIRVNDGWELAVTPVDAGDSLIYVLERSGVIFGRVVQAAGGKPIGGARVSGKSGLYNPSTVQTDSEGRFELIRFPMADVSLAVSAAGYAIERRTISLEEGASRAEVRIELIPGAGHLRGVVLSGDREPVAGAELLYLNGLVGTWAESLRARSRFIQTRTGPDGRFELASAPVGESGSLVVLPDGMARKVQWLQPVPDEVVEIVLSPTIPLRGRVVDESGEGVAGASVETFIRRFEDLRGETDASGRFRLEGYAAGDRVRVKVTAGDLSRELSDLVIQDEEITISLLRDGVLAGVVHDEAGGTLRDIRLTLHRSPPDLLLEAVDARSGEEGEFEIDPLPSGEYELFVEHPGFEMQRVDVDIDPGERKEIALELAKSEPLRGIVLSTGGVALPGATVRALGHPRLRPGRRMDARTDGGGRFAFDGFAAGDEVGLSVHCEGHLPQRIKVVVGPEEAEIRLEPCGAISGRVLLRQSGEPVPDFVLHLESETAPAIERRRHDSRGRFELTTVPIGDYTIRAVSHGVGDSSPVSIRVRAYSELSDLSLPIDEGGLVVTLTKRDASGHSERLSFTPVYIQRSDETFKAHTDEQGDAFFPRLAGGTWSIWAGERESNERRFEYSGRGVERVDLAARAVGTLSVHVRTSAGDPVSGETVYLLPEGGDNFRAWPRTDADGEVVIDGLIAGRYRVQVREGDARVIHPIQIGSGAHRLEIELPD
ncbi:MAG: carboxypeptidase regulatory-like domain-containing protein [Planctomycetota bacterium]